MKPFTPPTQPAAEAMIGQIVKSMTRETSRNVSGELQSTLAVVCASATFALGVASVQAESGIVRNTTKKGTP
jgi:hypothetical protein